MEPVDLFRLSKRKYLKGAEIKPNKPGEAGALELKSRRKVLLKEDLSEEDRLKPFEKI